MIIKPSTMPLLLVLSIACYAILSNPSAVNGETTLHWCRLTPFPNTCAHYMRQEASSTSPEQPETTLQSMAIRVAMHHAMLAREQLLLAGADQRSRPSWSDCIELFESAVQRLNSSAHSSPRRRTSSDVQTWLSAALTNLHTCTAGLAELGLPSRPSFLPLLANVSELISNSLAVAEKRDDDEEKSHDGEFPEWTVAEDRERLQARPNNAAADLVVAKDGTGDFRRVQEAINEASKKSGSGRFVIQVKEGVYVENVKVRMANLMLVGEGIGRTVITGSRSVGGGSTTFNSATAAVEGDGFIARGITFRNTAGPANRQAVALRCSGDRAVFYRCGFEGYQDTLYAHSNRQFYRECDVYGTVDFIFGNAAALLQACNIYARRPMPEQQNTVTAQGRTDPNQNTAISIQGCRVAAAPELRGAAGVRTYLGRPWQQYSRTVFMETYLGALIAPGGWLEWSGGFALETLFYGEYKNSGPGSDTSRRVRWRGYHVIQDASTASKFTAKSLIAGGDWLPASGVPFTDVL